MNRLALILVVPMFALVAAGAVAQTEPEGKTADAGRQALDRIQEDSTVADPEDSARNGIWEWLSEPPGVDTPKMSVGAASNGHPSRCAIWLSVEIKDCFDRFAACLYNFPKRHGTCYGKALGCAAKAEANYLACVAKYD